MDVGISPNHVNYLCMCVIGVCSLVFSSQIYFSHKMTGEKLVAN
jgi:hypothetical protein